MRWASAALNLVVFFPAGMPHSIMLRLKAFEWTVKQHPLTTWSRPRYHALRAEVLGLERQVISTLYGDTTPCSCS